MTSPRKREMVSWFAGCPPEIRDLILRSDEAPAMPMRVQHSLETWRAAERQLERLEVGTPARASAEEAVAEAREAYLSAVRVLAEGQGTTGIDRVPGAVDMPPGPAGIRAVADSLQQGSADDQRASDTDQIASDEDQRESDADMAALRDGGRRPAGDTQAQSSIRRLASAAFRDKNAEARDATADQRDSVIDGLSGIRRPD